jgi:8-oxo-dGTP pyrophosphatase MutT (NUDIX family)
MHRRPLLDLLTRYESRYPDERALVARIRAFAETHADCFERSCIPGHITASAWIVSADRGDALLTHHAKLGRWLQLGGHCDGDADPFVVALREAREESGMEEFSEASGEAVPLPLDMDIHRIPARSTEPAHDHLDLRYLLIAAPGQSIVVSEESHDLRWVSRSAIETLTDEESVLRLERKAREREVRP